MPLFCLYLYIFYSAACCSGAGASEGALASVGIGASEGALVPTSTSAVALGTLGTEGVVSTSGATSVIDATVHVSPL